MNLEHIDVFVEVVDAQSFTRAAARLGMPTSTVSARIARLEQRLGVTLIQRTTRQLSVTAAGRRYYEHCVRALSEVASAEQELSSITQQPSGKLVITAPADIADSLLVPLIHTYTQTYTAVQIELMVTNRQVDLIGENVDLAVRIGPLSDSAMIARKYIDSRVGLWASSAYLEKYGTPDHEDDLADHQMIQLLPVGRDLTLYHPSGRAVDIRLSGAVITDDVQNCRKFIESGAGIGFLPDFIGQNAGMSPTLVRVLPELVSDTFSVYFVWPSQQFVPQTVRKFIDLALSD
ncbi:HTH-type transcriptional regulator DmlR [Vibrio aerogenes CECT 7868]|uniref:HTH-type transcriptional regulator DmlR n=1 Tax=Vibrio aerogenes CECT 7868 TaxID=1216006 RepID=A0A1M5Y1L0_9VIBR|nr:HTH-type transcriptional regulator DmlR [Vibrio aerogenes CECT 7868]